MNETISFQEALRQPLPTVTGSTEYRKEEELLKRIDHILVNTKLEDFFLLQCFNQRQTEQETARQINSQQMPGGEQASSPKTKNDGGRENFLRNCRQALRCNILKNRIGTSFRHFGCLLAMSPLYQWFCKVENFAGVEVPSKSTLQKYSVILPAEELEKTLILLAEALADAARAEEIGIERELDLSVGWVDSTCLQANIHFPVDWVLLRDATRSLLGSIETIRRHGLLHRIGKPSEIMGQINADCMAMAAAGKKKKKGKQERKKRFRGLDRRAKTVEEHGKRYRQLLDEEWDKTDLSRAQAEVILRRMDKVLGQLPEARRQARERIIGGRKVKSGEKILSLFESDLHVIVRNKAGARVEFGNSLFLVETVEGFILHHELLKDASPGDGAWLQNNAGKIKEISGGLLEKLVGDRGFSGKKTAAKLDQENIIDNTCPKSPGELEKKFGEDAAFAAALKRRGQTEGRVAILKNIFLEEVPRSKGFENRRLQVAWAVLSHNLWVAARLPRKKQEMALAA